MVSSEKRRRQLARAKYERQQQRRIEARRRRRRNTVIGAGAAVVVLAGGAAWASVGLSGGSGPARAAHAASASPSAPSVSVPGCHAPAPGRPNGRQWKREPALTVDTKAAYRAVLSTDCGPVTLRLDPGAAPHTVNSFVFLTKAGFFDHTTCHRLTTQAIYVLQCGDPTGTGTGGPGYHVKDENLKGATYPAGTVAMANAGPNTNGSQFFLVYKDTQLPPNYTPFGRITGGLDVIKRIAAAGSTGSNGPGDGAPKVKVVIDKATVARV